MPQLAREFEQLSYTGMRDSLDPTTADPRKAFLLQNVYPSDTFLGAAVVGRPGYVQMGGQLGQVGFTNVQRVYQFTRLDGTQFTIAFCGGLMYTYNWGTGVWTQVVPTGGVVIDKSAIIYCATFANQLVVTDGVNLPWTWDGGVAFNVLTSAAVAFGPPAVYYAKLFFITASQRVQFIWSEENQPNVGYTVGGYNDAWVFGQTKVDALWLLMGTNERLYVFRARSISAVSGAVNPDFAAAGTREAVSETVGTSSPSAAVYYDDVIYFLDSEGRPYVIQVGGTLAPIWTDLRETLQYVPRNLLPQAVGTFNRQMQHTYHGLRVSAQDTAVQTVIVVDTRTQFIGGLFRGFTMTALDQVLDSSLTPFMVHGTSNGYVYQHGNPDGTLWDDEANASDGGTNPIQHIVTGTPLGFSVKVDKHFDRLDMSFRLLTNLTNVSVDYETPRSQGSIQTFSLASASALWDVAFWDQAFWSSINPERHQAVGLSGDGRWIRPRIIHQFAQERFGLCGMHVAAYDVGPLPGIP